MKAVNPVTGELIREYAEHSGPEVARRLELSEQAFRHWRKRTFAERAEILNHTARLLKERAGEYGLLMTREMGKPIASAKAEVEKCAWVCEYYAENAERFLSPEVEKTDASRSFVRFDPLGPVLAVMPWNFPFWQVFRFAAPALMAGNVGVLKHASNVPGSALAIGRVFLDAGLPEGVFQTLLIKSDAVRGVIEHPIIRAVTLTGSEAAGSMVASQAGKAIKKTVMELGGSDPFIVLGDGDLDFAVEGAVAGRCINNGQSCIAAKRFIVEEEMAEVFEKAFVDRMRKLKVGDPADPSTDIGPLAREDLRAELEDQLRRSVSMGAEVLTGGKRVGDKGYFIEPCVLGKVTPEMPVFREETFGPLAAVIRARDADHAVELANQSIYGLGASIWTGDPKRGEALAASIEAGAVFVNGIVKSDPRLPFGGIKSSGYGRELGREGIREFVNIKSVWIK